MLPYSMIVFRFQWFHATNWLSISFDVPIESIVISWCWNSIVLVRLRDDSNPGSIDYCLLGPHWMTMSSRRADRYAETAYAPVGVFDSELVSILNLKQPDAMTSSLRYDSARAQNHNNRFQYISRAFCSGWLHLMIVPWATAPNSNSNSNRAPNRPAVD